MDMLTSTALMGLNSQLSSARFEINNLRIQNQTLNMKITTLMNQINMLQSKENMSLQKIKNYERILTENKIDFSGYNYNVPQNMPNYIDYEKLLEEPIHVIAHKNKKFRKTWLKEQEFIADWMVSQKAFKELAIEFGEQLGLKAEHIIEKGVDKKLGVLNNEFKEEHNTNYSGLEFEKFIGKEESDKFVENIRNRVINRKK